jgi:hypothetical protein
MMRGVSFGGGKLSRDELYHERIQDLKARPNPGSICDRDVMRER